METNPNCDSFRGWLQLNCASHIRYGGGDRLQFSHLSDNHIGIFQAVSSDGANDPAGFPNFLERVRCIVCIAALEKAGDRRRARWLDKNSFLLCQPPLRSQNVFIADYIDRALRFNDGRARLLPARWTSDSNR